MVPHLVGTEKRTITSKYRPKGHKSSLGPISPAFDWDLSISSDISNFLYFCADMEQLEGDVPLHQV